ncbi:DeoR/GlpR family DNA-binding transcription regulator [Kiloniella majae]|uniref:DeoR/GlpR family DNA-binding transcription regulator n=1 Tax=Kiloniella majae TaxID=1938558 RepID=UPI000A279543|nr:DeoR family transcriptional regulator [Kiloniella majae]
MADQKRIGINNRQDQIIELVRERGYASIEMLAEKFGVSQQTIRRDIIYLSEKNLLQRHFGGAGLPAGIDGLAYPNRKVRNAREKAAIGREIAKQIPNGSSLFIDIGTTMEAVAEALVNHEGLRILTNHIGVVSILCEKTDFEIILPGGLVRNKDRAIAGETTTEFLKSFRVGYGIFGIGTITNDGQLLDYDYRDAQASRAALEISRHKFAAADHSKFNADAMMPFATAAEVDGIFTDTRPPKPIIEALDKAKTKLFVAQK